MQLGVAHALLVSRAEPPDVAVGVSTGAVNAVALAEILQAGSDAKSEREQVEAQVARFREVLEAYRQSRDDILPGLLPDVYQVDAQRPLRPTELPIHSQNERDRRGDAARSRAGLISLANYLLRVDLSIAAVTRATRALLGLRMAPEIRPLARRIGAVILESFRLWVVFASNLGNLSLLGSLLLKARVAPFFDWLADLPESKGVQAALQEGLLPRLHLSGVVNSIVRTISSLGSGRH
jgi:hypothetical protein